MSKYNNNFKFYFYLFDNYTKYAWAILPKDKSEKSTTQAFKKLLETSKRKPDKIWSDRVEEFYNSTLSDFLEQNDFQISSTHSDLKAVSVERFNRILLDRIKGPMCIEGKACWLKHLDAALEKYNKRVHREICVTPFDANDEIIPNFYVVMLNFLIFKWENL